MKEWKGVCSTVRGTPYSLLNPHHQEQAPECPKWSEQAMKSLKKTENDFGGVKWEVEFQIHEFSYAIFQRFYTQLLHLISYDT